jgi:transposase
MNSQEIFGIALGLSEPWFIERVELTTEATPTSFRELHIHINFRKGWKFQTGDGASCGAYDTEDRTWQHLDFFQHKCYLHARVPRIKLPDGKVSQVQVPWARPNSGFTLLFEAYAMLLIESEMPVCKASDCLRVTAPRVWRIFNYWISLAKAKDDLSEVQRIGIDETSSKKGHNYVTVVADIDTSRTIYACPERDAAVVDAFAQELESKGGSVEKISLVSMDMSPAFIAGALDTFPLAKIVFDKFHIIQSVNKAMDEVRKAERKGNELLKTHKYTVLRKYAKLTDEKKAALEELMMMYPILGDAYRLKELLGDVYHIPEPEEAKGYLWFWCDLAHDSGIQPFKKVAAMIRSHWSGVVAHFDTGITNGLLEGINSKIQLAKRRARGYRNINNYINMIYFLTAKLKFDYPHYPL